MDERMTFEKFKEEVLNRIRNRNDQLKSLFSAGDYRNIPGVLSLNSRILTHEGEVIPGKDSENYWEKVGKDLQGTNLNFKAPRLDAMELEVSPERKDEEIDFIAIEITEFSFEVGGTTYKGYIDPPYRHRVKCTIDD